MPIEPDVELFVEAVSYRLPSITPWEIHSTDSLPRDDYNKQCTKENDDEKNNIKCSPEATVRQAGAREGSERNYIFSKEKIAVM